MRLAVLLVMCLATLALAAPPESDLRVAASLASMPEPTGWTALLCGLLVVAFIARRKSNWPEG